MELLGYLPPGECYVKKVEERGICTKLTMILLLSILNLSEAAQLLRECNNIFLNAQASLAPTPVRSVSNLHFQISTVLVSLDRYRVLADHGMSNIF